MDREADVVKNVRPTCPGMFGQSLVSNNRGALDDGRETEVSAAACAKVSGLMINDYDNTILLIKRKKYRH